jgi:hypothetical protein
MTLSFSQFTSNGAEKEAYWLTNDNDGRVLQRMGKALASYSDQKYGLPCCPNAKITVQHTIFLEHHANAIGTRTNLCNCRQQALPDIINDFRSVE